MADLRVNLAGLQMKTPVMTASGTFGFGIEFADFMNLNDLGAVVVKGTTLNPRSGNAGVRIAETPAGMLNCIGLENPGSDAFIKTILPQCKRYEFPVIVNMSGSTVEEYGVLAEKLSVDGVAALELNISCPNVKEGGIAFGTRPESAAAVVREVKKHTNLPVIVKLSPNVTDIVEMAKYVEDAGADIISMINTLLGMVIDTRTWKPVLGNIVGGLSGPAVKPVAVRMVWQVAQAVKVPIIGMGGIMTAEDAIEFFLAGASAVSIGTANFVNPAVAMDVTRGIDEYLDARGIKSIQDIIGQVKIG
ncbi:MAG: dihydroorotate dehydrogenase [Selenomonadales bacterium]|nr:dihydroorotate dehydrogenase [Selenomonadales bacterium]MBQ2113951.1 dihydroorotate dehydrogenase [Selenomonadales bacterium]MBQ2246055.1 dihydroorotate dehydrogenase [Selenomonadales bacterium]MBR0324780.1 dihydroorotate dehydrogenase [Selenomonadales bacterium]